MSVSSDARTAAIAVNRFGLGARVDEPLPAEPQSWLLAQFAQYNAQPAAWSALPSSAVLAVDYANQFRAVREAGSDAAEQAARQTLRRDAQTHYRAAVNARATVALTTPAPFVERLVHFWANHFAVSIEKAPLASLAGAFEAEAIRPHVLGRFEDMLLAVERHPAMLLYLDQSRSIGPGSVAGRRAARLNPERQRGLNENLAREILELHTLGVRSGYGQADVTELARALTGWSIGGVQGTPYTQAANAMPGAYNFFPALHEPGTRTVLNRDYAQRGEAQAVAVLRDLAASPATARHVAQKLARHFVADVPPPALVDRLTQAFLRSGGALPEVYQVLVQAPEAWERTTAKFKTPWDWMVSALRGLGWKELREGRGVQVPAAMAQLGQTLWRPGSPAGYDDMAASWAAPDALMRRVELAQRLAAQSGSMLDARSVALQWLPGGLAPATATTIERAESPAIALALLLACPEFLRR